MIRHAPGGEALAVGALVVAMIEAAFYGLLMSAVGGAALNQAGVFATGVAAIDLSPLTRRADEEDNAAAWRAAKALPERSVRIIRHVWSGTGWTAETEGGKMPIK